MGYENNCIRLIDLETPIFRVFSADRFFETFVSRRLVLFRPHCWDDPFENFLYQVRIESTSGESVSISGLRRRLYGQCWTLHDESDAMWRIYAPNKEGIKVKTTVRKLIEAIYDPKDQFASLRYFIGRVEYAAESELLNFFANSDRYVATLTDASGRGPVEALLLKRREFEHEQEVRLIYQHSEDVVEDWMIFPMNPNLLFDEIVFDPRMSVFSVTAFTNYIRSLGFTNPIRQSRLYRLPDIPTKIVL